MLMRAKTCKSVVIATKLFNPTIMQLTVDDVHVALKSKRWTTWLQLTVVRIHIKMSDTIRSSDEVDVRVDCVDELWCKR